MGIVLRGNTIINFEDPNQPHAGALQGIGCFDGTFVDWIVENNVVVTNHWHGITLLGARGCIVRNNTVVDVDEESPGPPWISVDAHKDGTPPEDCVVANNLTTDLSNADSVTEEGNITFSMAERDGIFVDAAAFDFHLLDSAEAIDAASGEHTSTHDRDGIERPQGAAHDVGAYEWNDGTASTDDMNGTDDSSSAADDDDSAADDEGDTQSSGDAGSTGGKNDDSGDSDSEDGGCSVTQQRSTPALPFLAWALVPLAMGFRTRRRASEHHAT